MDFSDFFYILQESPSSPLCNVHDDVVPVCRRESLSHDEVEGDHRQFADMPKKQAIELALGEIE